MEYRTKQLAQLAGISSRTLRWYDEIGLLRPGRKTQGGYRLYGPEEVAWLQQILFFRRAGLPLMEIKHLLDEPGFDPEAALLRHLAALEKERLRLDGLIQNAQNTLRFMKGETEMEDKARFEGFKRAQLEENEEKYGAEVRCRYGEEAAAKANARWMGMSEEEYKAMQALEEELLQFLKRLRSKLLLETVMQHLVFPAFMRYSLLICCKSGAAQRGGGPGGRA